MRISALIQDLSTALTALYDASEASAIARIAGEELFGKAQVRLQGEADVNQLLAWNTLHQQLISGMPLQYALGKAWFMDLTLKVSPAVLIPRPETEELVEQIIKQSTSATKQILDIGTGSGCIAIALKKYIPQASVTAWDISEEALHIARENAHSAGTEITFVQQDILQNNVALHPQFDIIVSNPPYIHPDEKNLMLPNVLDHEPHIALFTPEEDVLVFYHRITAIALGLLKQGGQLWFEINPTYAGEILAIMQSVGLTHTCTMPDMQGKVRFASGTMP